MNQPELTVSAGWRKRFAHPRQVISTIAAGNPERGLLQLDGMLHSWAVAHGHWAKKEAFFGGISPNGSWIYHFSGGTLWRTPFDDGSQAEPLAAISPDFYPFSLSANLGGGLLGFSGQLPDGQHRVYLLPVDASAPQMLYQSTRSTLGPWLSFDGDLAVIATTERSQYLEYSLMAFPLPVADNAAIRVLQEYEGSIQPVAFAPLPGDARLLAETNATGELRPLIWDARSGDRTDFPLQEMTGDLLAWGWSPDGAQLLLCHRHQARQQLYRFDLERSTLHRLDHPAGALNDGYFVDNATVYVTWQDGEHPPQVIALSAHTGQPLMPLPGMSKPAEGIAWHSAQFPSSGGAMIQAWYALPKNAQPPFPTVIYAHDGPDDVLLERFDPIAQSWLDHGVAWMGVNYRGSATFGEAFQGAIYGFPGHREVDDLAAGYVWLVNQGIAHPQQIFLQGEIYGAYLVLQALGRRPELWAGGLAHLPLSADWRVHAPLLRPLIEALFGGSSADLPDQYRASSPITYVEAIAAPVWIAHPRDDSHYPVDVIETFAARLRDAGQAVEIAWLPAYADPFDVELQSQALTWVYTQMQKPSRAR